MELGSEDCGMSSVKDHYDTILAANYSWMVGDFDSKVEEQRALLEDLGLEATGGTVAVDLGCGPGSQSFALTALGYEVVSIDSSQTLLAELNERSKGQPIRAVEANILDSHRMCVSRST